MKWLTLFAVLSLAGCGGGSASSGPSQSGGTPAQNVVVSGQWDAITTPTNTTISSTNYYANVTNQGGGAFFAASGSVIFCANDDCYHGFFAQPQGTSLTGTTTGNQVSINVTGAGGYSATLTGTVSADGTTMNGTWTDSSTGAAGTTGPGTWTAKQESAVTGSYSGSFNSTYNPSLIPFTVTANITQAQDLTITGSATVANSACIAILQFGQGSRAIGGAFSLVDSTTSLSVEVFPIENGTLTFTNYSGWYALGSATLNMPGTCSDDSGSGTVTKQ